MAQILIIDDKPDEVTLTAQLNLARGMTAKTLHPEDVKLADLGDADLVLVDFQLEENDWPERQNAPISRQPKDGLALASLLRRHVHGRERDSPTAFAILSSEIAKLAFPLPAENREHVLARLNNLEWVFQKSTPGKPDRLGDQVIELAEAVRSLPEKWPNDDAVEAMRLLATILRIDNDRDGCDQQLEDVAACIPPIHELSEWSHGLAVLRWLLQRILPYPCFLWDSYQLAARLRVDHKWLVEALDKDATFEKWISVARYKGLLAEFHGRRWWRSQIELLLWQATEQRSFDTEEVHAALGEQAQSAIKASSPLDHPIVCVNSDFRPLDQYGTAADSVRIRPDDWPSFADQPWTTVQLAKSESGLRAIVISEDRGKLNGDH